MINRRRAMFLFPLLALFAIGRGFGAFRRPYYPYYYNQPQYYNNQYYYTD